MATVAGAERQGPLSQREYRTTSAAITLANLNGHIDDLRRFGVADAPARIELLLVRGQYFGRIADYETADALATALVAERPNDAMSLFARARVAARWHRFAAALHDLDVAAKRSPTAPGIEEARAGVLQALGQHDAALAIRRRRAAATPDVQSLGALAALHAERGDTAEATPLFRAAERAFRDVTPFPLAWLAEQQGRMWVRAGDLDRAREFYAAAYERLPQYPAVVAPLAWLEAARGNGTRAVALLEAAAGSDDPQAAALLASVLPLTGRKDEAARWQTRARTRYEELLRTHPEAFAHHAAEFFLAAGADPARALVLAKEDLARRQTPGTYALVLRAAEATGDHAAACAAATGYLAATAAVPAVTPLGERAVAERVRARCATEATDTPTPVPTASAAR